MIPENKKEAVGRALLATFGVAEFEQIRELLTGLSPARIFRITVLGKPYLLRVIIRDDAMSDPARWFTSMQAAAEEGIAPRIWYMNLVDRICITDFVDAKPFPKEQARQKMPELLRRLHALPAFPRRINYLNVMDGFVQKFKEAKFLPDQLAEEVLQAYSDLQKSYATQEEDLVSCHNDLKPENMLYDGERVWLVDWEAAFLNDRYLDLAVVSNFVVRAEEEEKAYLRAYFGRDASESELFRFAAMRRLLHLIYASFMILSGPLPDVPMRFEESGLSFGEYHDLMWAGGVDLASMDSRREYALVHLNAFVMSVRLRKQDLQTK